MIRLQPGTLAATSAIFLVLAVSVTLDWRRGAIEKRASPRFSGSLVVANLPSLLPPARLPSRLRVAIVRDEAAASYYSPPAALDSIVNAWRRELTAIGADAQVVTPAALDRSNAQVLVIPASPCLTVATRAAIEAADARGQGLIVTGLAGLYDAGCRSLGYGLIIGLTGASRAQVIEPRSMMYVVLPAGSPLSADLPPGARMELKPAGQVALRHAARDAYYSDYALQPQPASNSKLLDGALVRSTIGNARVVYWGFELSDVLPRAWNQGIARLLVRNSVAWAGRVPMAWLDPWPRGHRAAAVFAQDVEAQYGNARYALDSLRAAGIPGTYFLTSNLALRYRRLSRAMAEQGEVGTHSENHRRLGGLPKRIQLARLRTTQDELTWLFGSPVAGLRPPEEQFDTATMSAWVATRGRYLFGVNDGRVAAPELLRIGKDTLVLMGRTGGDDITMAGPDVNRPPDIMTALFLKELQQARALGGLFLFSYHSQLLARPEFVPVLARVARSVANDPSVWPATAGTIASWWRSRAALRLETQVHTNDLVVIAHNRGAIDVSGAVANLALPTQRRVLGANAKLLRADAGSARLALPNIPAGKSVRLTLRFVPNPAPQPRVRASTPRRAWWEFWRRK